MENTHTIVLMQPEKDKYSRTYYDFETLNLALTGICNMFENTLREINVGLPTITYDVEDLFRWLDNLPDFSMLILDPKTRKYAPYGKTYIKNSLFGHIRRATQQK